MENINKRLSEKLNVIFENNIKLSFVSTQSIIIVTNDDKCYEFRKNYFKDKTKYSFIALSDNKDKIDSLIEESYVESLSHKQIIDFKNGSQHRIARTIEGKLYCWGENSFGVLGDGREDWKTHEPELNKSLKHETIIEMCCGAYHTLVLTNNGEVYAWGSNCHGQIGNGKSGAGEFQSKPFKLMKNWFDDEEVQAISCGYFHSVALTKKGCVFSWGTNVCGELGIGSREDSHYPKLVPLSARLSFRKISCGLSNSLFLSRDEDIYFCGLSGNGETADHEYFKIPMKLDLPKKFNDIVSHFNYPFFAAISVDETYYICGDDGQLVVKELKEIDLISFDAIFEHYFQITYKPIEKRIIRFEDVLIPNIEYKKKFIEKRKIGEGSFGEVFEVSDHDRKKYAIKKIKLRDMYIREFVRKLEFSYLISKMNNEKFVTYLNFWLENDFIMKKGINTNIESSTIYIQMELCDLSLYELIVEIKNNLNFFSTETMTLTSIGYYIACEIFIEILEAVKDFHELKPPIIHRDLKPENIMIMIDKRSKSLIKIADFGLAIIHEYANQSHTQDRGSSKYIAPEVGVGRHYDTRADIFSLGIVLQYLFDIDLIRDYEKQNVCLPESFLINKYVEISNLCNRMTQRRVLERPQIKEILENKHLWTLNGNEFDFKRKIETVLHSNESKESSILKILKNKLFFLNNPRHFDYSEVVKTDSKAFALKLIEDIYYHYYREKKINQLMKPVIRFKDNFIQTGKYDREFTRKENFPLGSYGEVFESTRKFNGVNYAIKKIKFETKKEKEFLEEVALFPIISKLRNEKCVQYFEAWLENDVNIETGIKTYIKNFTLYIQMELCDKELEYIIREIKGDLNLFSNKILTPLGYYIVSELFIEILEGVKYLHEKNEQKDQIIHKDLNPWNIMLKIVKESNSFVKIVDFGLATIHKYAHQSHNQDRGHPGYLAPEAQKSTKYDHRADIYSLGKIVIELFFIDLESFYKIENECERLLMEKYQEIQKICVSMTQDTIRFRPETIEKILDVKDLWALNASEFKAKKVFEESNINEDLFVYKLLKIRLSNN